jgi:hypothetical protein
VNRRRAWIVAAQTLISAVLAVVIVLTVLNPDNDHSLFGIEIGNDREQVVREPDDEPGDGRHPGERGGRDSELRRGGGAAAATAGQAAPGEAAPGSVVGPPPAAPLTRPPGESTDQGNQGPPDEQYANTLARLTAAIN